MLYARYFNEGQKVVLRRISPWPDSSHLDSLSGALADCSEDFLDICLPYTVDATEVYPFFPGMPFQVLSDWFGLGLRCTGLFEQVIGSDRIRLKLQGDLEFFFRRQHQRTPVELWISYQRGTQSLRTVRRTWKRHIEILQSGRSVTELPPVLRQAFSLGGGGLQLYLPAPVVIPELFLIYLALDDKGPLVCAICETVWVDPPDSLGGQLAGLQFLNILDADRDRIIRLVRSVLRQRSAV
jgi:hypothetical protein